MTHTSQRFCLRWNNHQTNLLTVFDQLLQDQAFVDVTLAVDGQFLRAHKMVLSACSPYFQSMFVGHPENHPIVILKDIPFADMRSLLDFMYKGEVSVEQDRLTGFLKIAETLRIKGLTEVSEEKCNVPAIAASLVNSAQSPPSAPLPPGPPDLHRIQVGRPVKRARSPNDKNSSGLVASTGGKQIRRARSRRLSDVSDIRVITSEDGAEVENRNNSNVSDSPFSQGPPNLLEVNMSDNSPVSPQSDIQDEEIHEIIGEEEEEEDEEMEGEFVGENKDQFCFIDASSYDGNNPSSPGGTVQIQEDDVAKSQQSVQPARPPELPMLRLVPKSRLLAVFSKNDTGDESHNNNNKQYNRNFTNGAENDGSMNHEDSTFSSNESFLGTPPPSQKPQTRRRMRRRIACSSDPTEQLTEMSVRGLNLFRYATVDEGVYKCTECAKTDMIKTFKNKYSFQRHAFLYHEGCQRKVFPCPVCGKEFSRPDKMKNHLKTVHDCFMPKECLFPPPPIPIYSNTQ